MIWEVHQDMLGSNRVKSSKPSPSCPERPSFWPHVWAGIPKTVGPAAPASWWGANAFFPHPTPSLLAKAAVWWDEEGRRTGDTRRQGRTGKVGGRGSVRGGDPGWPGNEALQSPSQDCFWNTPTSSSKSSDRPAIHLDSTFFFAEKNLRQPAVPGMWAAGRSPMGRPSFAHWR